VSLGSMALNVMGEPQAVHCGPWFCLSSMCRSSQFGAMSSPASHPVEADFIGSLMTIVFCTELQLGQSNSRCSNPTGPGLMLVSVIRDVHCRQRGRSIGVSRDLGENWDFDMTLPGKGGSVTELSVTGNCQWLGGDGITMPQCERYLWSILLIHQKLIYLGVPQSK
jgi:hypothetical protein